MESPYRVLIDRRGLRFHQCNLEKREDFNSDIDPTSCAPPGKVWARGPVLGGQPGCCVLLNCKPLFVQWLLDVWLLPKDPQPVPTVLREKPTYSPRAADFLSQRGACRDKTPGSGGGGRPRLYAALAPCSWAGHLTAWSLSFLPAKIYFALFIY